jgi:hypothetical protein
VLFLSADIEASVVALRLKHVMSTAIFVGAFICLTDQILLDEDGQAA